MVRPAPIDLSAAGNGDYHPGRPTWVLAAWLLVEHVLVSHPLQVSSRLRAWALRRFGATIGEGVVLRPRLRVKFPWHLTIGDRSWIGEGVWLHNQADLVIGSDTVVSQEAFVTTGSHETRRTMDLVVAPVTLGRGVWVTSRATILAGVTVGDDAIVLPGSVVSRDVPAGTVVGGVPARHVRERARDEAVPAEEPRRR